MKLYELINEAIEFPPNFREDILAVLNKWIPFVKKNLGDDPIRAESKLLKDFDNTEKLSIKLENLLQPIIQKIVDANILDYFGNMPKYTGHKILVRVFVIDESTNKTKERGSHGPQWTSVSSKLGRGYRNDIHLNLFPSELISLINGDKKALDELLATIEHESTHSIQTLHSKFQNSKTRPSLYVKNKNLVHDSDHYYMNKHELSAFARGTVSKIESQANRESNPIEYIDSCIEQIQMGRSNFPNQSYQTFIEKLKTQDSKHPIVNKLKQKLWRAYIKKTLFLLQELKSKF